MLLTLLTAAETVAAVLVARGFWIGVSVTGFLLVAFVVHLRNRALTEQRQRRAEQQYAAWVRRRQAAVRREQARRAAARRELLERHWRRARRPHGWACRGSLTRTTSRAVNQ